MNFQEEIQDPSPAIKKPYGIGGWLLIPLIGLLGTIISQGHEFANKLLPTFKPEIWSRLTSEGSNIYHSMWVPFYVFQVAGNVLVLVSAIFLIIMFFKRNKLLPKLIIGFYAISLLFTVINYLSISSFPTKLIPAIGSEVFPVIKNQLVFSTSYLFIFVPYFLFSKRVMNTFIE